MLWHLHIVPAPGQEDLDGHRLATEATELGLPGPWTISASRGFLIEDNSEGISSKDWFERLRSLAAEVLVDPVTEQFDLSPCLPRPRPTADPRLLRADLVLQLQRQFPDARSFEIDVNEEAGTARILADDVAIDPVEFDRWTVRSYLALIPPSVSRPWESVHVMPKPGVTDPVAESALSLLHALGLDVAGVRTIRSYHVVGPREALPDLIRRVLSNDAVEHAVVGELVLDHLGQGKPYRFERIDVPILALQDDELVRVSKEGQLALSLDEMKTIQAHFAEVGRDPTDCELETIAQTWSEHCSHKTLRGLIDFDGEIIDNLLKQTIFKATKDLNLDWLVSVFEDNAGVVRFDENVDVCFKVETHNHPSAIDPYGGSNTGLGGVIRDVLGTGLAGKPIANTDVFCVAPPDTAPTDLPPGVLHPRRVLEGVVAGVRDYGNRMGIPTVNGALAVDPKYLANPLVFCGTVGVIPRGMSSKHVEPGDRIVALGGRTGRDGIHGATFSSLDLSADSEEVSGGSVQIGNAITEKMVLDVLIQARDRGLYRSLTDCGAGGFSSAVGEMGATSGAEVDLEKAPLKYEGLSYTEIWISEAQERMVLAVPPEKWPELKALCDSEDVEATDLGRFTDTGLLTLRYQGNLVAELSMDFLHEGRPKVTRKASYTPREPQTINLPRQGYDYSADLLKVLGHWDVASKEWIIRQYDHEVQGRTVIKPLVGEHEDGPGDAVVIQPVRGSNVGLSISCGINPRYGEHDPYAMAMLCVDEAIRNAVAVGADPDRIALLDNFCWGNPERPETLGSLVMAARGCHDAAIAYRTPFISGKDSLYNEYDHEGRKLAIPPTLLISAIGRVPDVRKCVTMDLKEPGNLLYVLGGASNQFGGSVWAEVTGRKAGKIWADPHRAVSHRAVYRALHSLMQRGLIRSCHDVSEGGPAAALAEMAMAGGLGVEVDLIYFGAENGSAAAHDASRLFGEGSGRFVLEIRPSDVSEVTSRLFEVSCDPGSDGVTRTVYTHFDKIGRVRTDGEAQFTIVRSDPPLVIQWPKPGDGHPVIPLIDLPLSTLKAAWQRPLHPAHVPG
ncbi:MAG: phosphoribosylformylglycinamidine synthase [Planctomycetota bacterium]|nr:phosphoribosylformylglycinamidine synthase [Planctomycetota bacterium]